MNFVIEPSQEWKDSPEIDQLAQSYSDLYKDAYGFRTRCEWTDDVVKARKMVDDVAKLAWEQGEEDERREQANYKNWQAHISKLMSDHNISKAVAIKWDMEAYDTIWNPKKYGYHPQIIEQYIWKIQIGYERQAELEKILG